MNTREGSINNFLNLENCHDVCNNSDYSLHIKYHSSLPLKIITYKNIKKWKETSPIDACRGLILNSVTNQVVSRGFDRFIPKHIDSNMTIEVKRATVKEDGSLIFLFKFNESWMLSTMHDFATNKLPFGNFTYEELFLQIIDQPLNMFAENLLKQFDDNKNIMTFCFEMCSTYNKIIRKYQNPCLYLISAFGGKNGNIEINIPKSIQLANNIHKVTEVDFNNVITYQELTNKVKEFSKTDYSFEGLVVEILTPDGKNQRIKVKNQYYLIQHTIVYRGWSNALPKILVPIIVDKLDENIYLNILDSLDESDKLFSSKEILKRINYCKNIINLEYEKLKNIINQIMFSDDKHMILNSKKNYVLYLSKHFLLDYKLWNSFFIDIYELIKKYDTNIGTDTNTDISILEIFNRHMTKQDQINKIFKYNDPFINNTHPSKYCMLTQELADLLLTDNCCNQINSAHSTHLVNQINHINHINQMSSDPNICYCGSAMKIIRLRSDFARYKVCHCGENFGYLKYLGYNYLGVCSDYNCLCTHEVNKFTLQPLGYPCSEFCKNLRLNIHEIIDSMIKKGLAKSECYKLISDIIKKDLEETHMAKLGISDCVKILLYLNGQNKNIE